MLGVKGSVIGIVAAFGVLATGSSFAAEPAKAKSAAKSGGVDQVAVFETSKGRMVVEFWDKDAPKTVANFKKLARSGYYNGTGFHRILAGFMIQGGDPKSKNPKAPDLGTGGPGWTIPDEFNSHKHVKGVLSMAHTAEPNSGGSQFFIMHGNASSLDGKYSAFGHVIEGMDVVDAIANVRVGPNPMMPGEVSKPLEWVTLRSVKILPRSAAMGGGTKAASTAPKSGASKAAAKTTEAPATPASDKAAAASAAAGTPAASSAPADSTKK